MLKRWRNKHGVNVALSTRTSSLPMEGLVVQPSELSQEEISEVMRAGRASMMNRYGVATVQQSLNNAREHLANVDRMRVRQ